MWTAREDDLLRKAIARHGSKNWKLVVAMLDGRTAKQCRQRWNNHINPAINKNPWSKEEDITILDSMTRHGFSWTRIAEKLPGRTPSAIANHFHQALKRLYNIKMIKLAGDIFRIKVDPKADLPERLAGIEFEVQANPNHRTDMVERPRRANSQVSSGISGESGEDESGDETDIEMDSNEMVENQVASSGTFISAPKIVTHIRKIPTIQPSNEALPSISESIRRESESVSIASRISDTTASSGSKSTLTHHSATHSRIDCSFEKQNVREMDISHQVKPYCDRFTPSGTNRSPPTAPSRGFSNILQSHMMPISLNETIMTFQPDFFAVIRRVHGNDLLRDPWASRNPLPRDSTHEPSRVYNDHSGSFSNQQYFDYMNPLRR